MTKIVCAINVQIVCNIKPYPWSQISSRGSGFLVLGLRFLVQNPGQCVKVLGT